MSTTSNTTTASIELLYWTSSVQFIKKVRVIYSITQTAAVRSLSAHFIQYAVYDSNRTDAYERFTVYNLEIEWWNFNTYTVVLDTMSTVAKNITSTKTTEVHISFFSDPDGQDLAQVSFMYSYFDVNAQNHRFYDAYQEILNQFNATGFNFKTNVRPIGYRTFQYSTASSTQPP